MYIKLVFVTLQSLSPEERPKGLCKVPQHVYSQKEGVLVMVARLSTLDSTFLPANLDSPCQLKLYFKHIQTGEN